MSLLGTASVEELSPRHVTQLTRLTPRDASLPSPKTLGNVS